MDTDGTVSWEDRFEELRRYKSEHGHTNVPTSHPTLGNWVYTQREKLQRTWHGEGALLPNQEKKLNELGLAAGSRDERWDQKYEALKVYMVKNGNRPIIRKHNRTLYNWCFRQRRYYKNGTLQREKKAKLEKLGYDWILCVGWGGPEVNESKALFDPDEEEEVEGGNEITSQLVKVRKALGEQGNEEEVEDGDEIIEDEDCASGSENDGNDKTTEEEECGEEKEEDDEWMIHYERLRKYRTKHGDCLVPKEYRKDPELGKWVDEQRSEAKKAFEGETSSLTYDRFTDLDLLGFRFVW